MTWQRLPADELPAHPVTQGSTTSCSRLWHARWLLRWVARAGSGGGGRRMASIEHPAWGSQAASLASCGAGVHSCLPPSHREFLLLLSLLCQCPQLPPDQKPLSWAWGMMGATGGSRHLCPSAPEQPRPVFPAASLVHRGCSCRQHRTVIPSAFTTQILVSACPVPTGRLMDPFLKALVSFPGSSLLCTSPAFCILQL